MLLLQFRPVLRVPTLFSLTNCFPLSPILPHDDFSYEETVYGDLKELPFKELPVKEDFVFDTRCEYSFELYLDVVLFYLYSHKYYYLLLSNP